MKLEVHIKDKIFTVHCGEGKQKIQYYPQINIDGLQMPLS
jgi:hypothetical protein